MMRALLLALLVAGLGRAQISPPGTASVPVTYQASTPASANGSTLAALTTDFWCIQGSASKTVFVTSIEVTGELTSASLSARLNLVMRSTLNTGGTSSTLTAAPLDPNNAAATATVVIYTVNPASLGNLVGVVKSYVAIQNGTPLTTVPPGPALGFVEEWGTVRATQPLTLRGTTQEACLNLGAATSLTTVMVTVEWYEQ